MIIYYYRDFFHYQPYRSYNTLYKPCNVACELLWKTDYLVSGITEQSEAKQIIADQLTDAPSATLARVTLVSKHIYETFGKRYGQPKAALLQLSPLNQYKFLSKNTTDSLWCGIYANMVSYFAWSQQITARNIEMKYHGDSHVVSECYIPELKKWIFIDPTFGMLGLKNEQGIWFDLQSFRQALRRNERIFVLKNINGQLQFTPLNLNESYLNHYYKPTNSTDLYYHHTSLREAYKPLEKVKRYLLPVSWYYIYDPGDKTNIRFGIRLLFIFLWLLTGTFLVFRFFKN